MALRLRLTALVFFAAVLLSVAGGVLFVSELRRGLVSSLDASLSDRATLTVKSLADEKSDKINLANSVPAVATQGPALAQVLTPPDRLVAATPAAPTRPYLDAAQLARAEAVPQHLVATALTASGRLLPPVRVLATRVPGTQPLVLVLASPLQTINQAVTRARDEALVAGALICALATIGASLLARAALGPVERMRAQAAAISAQDHAARLPVPVRNDEIAALATTFNGLLGRLQDAIAAQRMFVADAGHELRTPLAVLGAELELAAQPGRSHEYLVEAVANAREETDRLARLARDLLLIACADEPDAYFAMEPTDLQALIQRSAQAWQSRAAERSVTIEGDAPADVVVELDPDRLRQSIDNLVDNALRSSPPDSIVLITGRTDDETVRVEVTDSGPGFPVDFLPHAFERFRRPDQARGSDDGGTGLGLAIVAALAKVHGGTVTAANRDGGGASVTIVLPRHPVQRGSNQPHFGT